MLSTGQNQPVTLFSYLMLLNIGVLVLLRFRKWPSLMVAALAGTVLLYCGWHDEYFTSSQRLTAFAIVLSFFVFYNSYIFLSRSMLAIPESRTDPVIVSGAASFFFIAFLAQQDWETSWLVTLFALLLAGAETGLAWLAGNRVKDARMTALSYSAVAFVMTVTATSVTLKHRWLLPALAAEVAVAGWAGLKLDRPVLRAGSYLLGIVTLIKFSDDIVLYLEPFERFIPLLNGRFIACAATAAGFYALSVLMNRNRDRLEPVEKYLPTAVFVITHALFLGLLSFEVNDFFRYRSSSPVSVLGTSGYACQVSLSVLWAFYASVLTGAGIYRQLQDMRFLGILLLGATVLKVFLVDLSSLQTFYRIISFIVLGLLLLAVSYSYNRFKHLIFGEKKS